LNELSKTSETMKKKTYKQLLSMEDPVTWITAYDYPLSYCCEQAGIDMILVGDSGGMVQLGYDNTVPVTMDEMITMCRAVRRGAPNTFIVGDMPMGSYEVSREQAITNAIRFIKEGGCDAVKLEGGARVVAQLKGISDAGVDVIGHLGFTPQSMNVGVHGKTDGDINDIFREAIMIGSVGVKMILFEALTNRAGDIIKGSLLREEDLSPIKCMGIGSGIHMDGQLIIIHDLLGFYHKFKPKFAKNYVESVTGTGFTDIAIKAVKQYVKEVKAGEFPSKDYWYE
jgi:3-methyl-2-oxobutanoate hydroxymethyltransferase